MNDHWEILSPGDLFLSFGGVGEVDEEALIVLEGVLGIQRLPDSVVVGPALDKHYDVLGLQIAFEEVLERLIFSHDT